MPMKKIKEWLFKQRLKRNKKMANFAKDEAIRMLKERKSELLDELKKTVREEVIPRGVRKGFILVSVGKKESFDRIKYKNIGYYNKEIYERSNIAQFTYQKVGRTMAFYDFSVGPYYGQTGLRNLGIATMMMDVAKDIAKRNGLDIIRLRTDNQGLIKMYKKMGFRVTLRMSDGNAEMMCFLTPESESLHNPNKPMEIYGKLSKGRL